MKQQMNRKFWGVVLGFAALVALLPSQGSAFMRSDAPERCREQVGHPDSVSQKHVIFRHGFTYVSDPRATIHGLEGVDCQDGYFVDSVKIESLVQVPGQGAIENTGVCRTDMRYYRDGEIASYAELVQAFNNDKDPGVLEISFEDGSCDFRYHRSLSAFRALFRDFICQGRVGLDPMVSCQHVRRIRSRRPG